MEAPLPKEERIQAAIIALQNNKVKSVREAAKQFGVPRSTLDDRFRGRRGPNSTSKQSMQRLSPAEEDSIIKAIYQLDAWGWPMSISVMEHLASQLLLAKGDTEPLGRNWYLRFLRRHPELQTRRSRALDQARKDAIDHSTLQQWFDLFQTTRLKYDIADNDIYNMDEKGCMKGIGDSGKVIIPRRELEKPIAATNKPSSIQPGNRDWVSIIECISRNGFVLPPFIIFQGSRIQQDWVPEHLDGKIVLQVSSKGWTDCSIAIDWIRHFDQYTRHRTLGKYRLLILDGHASHVSPQFVEFCVDNNIVPLCLPPHSTHELQPLDVGVFGPLARQYRHLVSQSALFSVVSINNNRFLMLYPKARKTMAKNAISAWRVAGLIPFNPERLLAQYAPKPIPFDSHNAQPFANAGTEAPTSTRGSLPIPPLINSIVDDVCKVVDSPVKRMVVQIQTTFLTLHTDNLALNALNQELVKKGAERRKTATRKHLGEARVLSIEAIRKQVKQRAEKEAAEAKAKERRKALRGVVGFAKNVVWKEMPVDYSIFQ